MSLDDLRQTLDHIDNDVAAIARLCDLNPGPLLDAAVEHIYRPIIEEMRNFEVAVHDAPKP